MVSSPRPPRPGPAATAAGARTAKDENGHGRTHSTHASEYRSVRYWSEETNATTIGEVFFNRVGRRHPCDGRADDGVVSIRGPEVSLGSLGPILVGRNRVTHA